MPEEAGKDALSLGVTTFPEGKDSRDTLPEFSRQKEQPILCAVRKHQILDPYALVVRN